MLFESHFAISHPNAIRLLSTLPNSIWPNNNAECEKIGQTTKWLNKRMNRCEKSANDAVFRQKTQTMVFSGSLRVVPLTHLAFINRIIFAGFASCETKEPNNTRYFCHFIRLFPITFLWQFYSRAILSGASIPLVVTAFNVHICFTSRPIHGMQYKQHYFFKMPSAFIALETFDKMIFSENVWHLARIKTRTRRNKEEKQWKCKHPRE